MGPPVNKISFPLPGGHKQVGPPAIIGKCKWVGLQIILSFEQKNGASIEQNITSYLPKPLEQLSLV
jgi:hypothetical protein